MNHLELVVGLARSHPPTVSSLVIYSVLSILNCRVTRLSIPSDYSRNPPFFISNFSRNFIFLKLHFRRWIKNIQSIALKLPDKHFYYQRAFLFLLSAVWIWTLSRPLEIFKTSPYLSILEYFCWFSVNIHLSSLRVLQWVMPFNCCYCSSKRVM